MMPLMALRKEIAELLATGNLPPVEGTNGHYLDFLAGRIQRLPSPLTLEEAQALLSCFGSDSDPFLATALLDAIETAPGPAVRRKPPKDANRWLHELWERQRQR
jgi:hypothetical protein